jgi:hypothetical protein
MTPLLWDDSGRPTSGLLGGTPEFGYELLLIHLARRLL